MSNSKYLNSLRQPGLSRFLKWYLIPPCLTLSNKKVRIEGKVEQSRERSCAVHPLHLGVVAIEKKGAFWSPSTTVANFTYYNITK